MAELFERAVLECNVPGNGACHLPQSITDITLESDYGADEISNSDIVRVQCFWCSRKVVVLQEC